MSKLLRQIASGWMNSFLDKVNLLSPEKKQVAVHRMEICAQCPIRTNEVCDPSKKGTALDGTKFEGCGCFIEKKTMCMDCECPGQYWKATNL